MPASVGPHPFRAWGPSHWAVLGATAAGAAALLWYVRRGDPARRAQRERRASRALATALVVEETAALGLALHSGTETLRRNLPFQLCDWVVVAAFLALVRGRQLPYELAYFWGLAGTVQALLTPDLTADFPDPAFLSFTALHGTVIVSILYLTAGRGMRPRPDGPLRAWLGLQVYAVTATVANLALGTNYGYLRSKPAHPSLLDSMGPWPVYVLGMEALGMALFFLLGIPFGSLRRRGRRAP